MENERKQKRQMRGPIQIMNRIAYPIRCRVSHCCLRPTHSLSIFIAFHYLPKLRNSLQNWVVGCVVCATVQPRVSQIIFILFYLRSIYTFSSFLIIQPDWIIQRRLSGVYAFWSNANGYRYLHFIFSSDFQRFPPTWKYGIRFCGADIYCSLFDDFFCLCLFRRIEFVNPFAGIEDGTRRFMNIFLCSFIAKVEHRYSIVQLS